MNRRVDIWEDIKCYQHALSYTLSKADYSMEENIYMLPSDMNLNIRSGNAAYNNKIILSDGKFSLGKNDKVNTSEMAVPTPKISPKFVAQLPNTTHKNLTGKTAITHEEEKLP